MKNRKLMTALCSVVLIGGICAASAQPADTLKRKEMRRPAPPTAEQIAEWKTDCLKETLDLSDKQYKKVYKVYLQQAETIASAIQNNDRPAGPRKWSGNCPQGSEVKDGRDRRMSMRRPAGPPREGRRSSSDSVENRRERIRPDVQLESSEQIAARDAEMKKILSNEQYAKWTEMEQRRRMWYGRKHARHMPRYEMRRKPREQ